MDDDDEKMVQTWMVSLGRSVFAVSGGIEVSQSKEVVTGEAAEGVFKKRPGWKLKLERLL